MFERNMLLPVMRELYWLVQDFHSDDPGLAIYFNLNPIYLIIGKLFSNLLSERYFFIA